MASGLAAAEFVDLGSSFGRIAVPSALVALGGVVAGTAYRRWEGAERALRLGEPLPYSTIAPLLGLSTAVLALAAVVLIVVSSGAL
jgi:uncharacterized membrane protein YidH (DUF202 family)